MLDLHHSKVLITGGTGSWGHELVRQILEKYPHIPEIRIYSRGEYQQVDMRREFGAYPQVKFIIGDIRDKSILHYATKGVDVIFHLAALKHVPVCEENSWEAVLTNIHGTQNVIESAMNNGVKLVVGVSTDKAVDPFNLYGVTKACGEKLMINANFNYTSNGGTRFICIRGGNVIGTNGSVFPLFKKQLLERNEVMVTDLQMSRYLMSTRDAIALLFKAVECAIGGELFVMRMPAATLDTIAKVMIKLFGNDRSGVKAIGMRPGEKLHELLVSKNEAPFTRVLSDNYFVVLPQIVDEKLIQHYQKFAPLQLPEFGSTNAHQLSHEELEAILLKEPWLMVDGRIPTTAATF